jgi:uncharacterized membrane protein
MLAETIYLDILRVLHILAGITWIGLLYYFNFVQGKAFNAMDASARQNATLNLVPQALFYFRWAAFFTVLIGVMYIASAGAGVGGFGGYWDTAQFYNIAIGGTMGIIMGANVWFIIWPMQKKIIAATRATVEEGAAAPPEQAGWTRAAFLASRTNTMLSFPMLFFMVAARNLPQLWA